MEEYTTTDIQKIFVIDRQRLREWIDKEYIYPSINRAHGIGTKNIFNRWDLYGIQLFMDFIDTGIKRSEARFVYEMWSDYMKGKSINNKIESSIILLIHSLIPKSGMKIFDTRYDVEIFFMKEEKIRNFDINKKFPSWARWEVINLRKVIEEVDRKIIEAEV